MESQQRKGGIYGARQKHAPGDNCRGWRGAVNKVWVTEALTTFVCFGMQAPGYCRAKPGFDDEEIRIGSWGPQTGPAAPWGSISRGAGLLFQMLNEDGGIHGRKIKFILRDDQYNPALTKLVVKDLVERQCVLVITAGLGSAPTLAVKDYLASNNILAVGMCTGAKELVMPTNPYLFSSFNLFGDEMSVLTKYVVERLGIRRIGFLYQNDPMGWDALNGARERMHSYNLNFVSEIQVGPAEKDLSSQVLRFKKDEAECVMMQVTPAIGVLALKTAASISYRPQWVSADTLGDTAAMYNLTGGLWEGVITGSKLLPANSGHKLIEKYRSATKRLMPEQAFDAWFLCGIMFAEPLVEALKITGRNLSTEKLLKSLNSIKEFQGVGPRITWTPDQHQGVETTRINQCGPKGSCIVLQDWTANELQGWKTKSAI